MSDLIRGGQVTFHKFRMLMQVTKVLSRVSVILIFVSIIYSYYKDISSDEWNVGFTWIKKEVLKNFKDENYKITYKNIYDNYKTIRVKEFDADPYVYQTINKFEIVFYKGLAIAAIMLSIIVGSMLVFFWIKGRNIKLSKNIRGIFLSSEKDLKKEIKKHNKCFKGYKPFKLADFEYPINGRKESFSSGEQSHTMLLGATGAGKTSIIKNLIDQLHKRNQKAIIVDVKGDFIKYFYRPLRGDIILNPLDVRGKNWSIFKETTPLKGFSTIAKSLLPKDSKGDPIWTEAARAVLAELANLYVSEGLSMSEFGDKIFKSDLATLVKLLEKTSASKVINEDIEKAALSVLMVLSTYLRPLKLYRSAEDCFSITDWVNDQSQQNFLFISSRSDVKEDLNPLISTQVDIAVTALRSLKEESNIPKIWFILDELPYFEQSIPSLKDGLAMSRSYGGCFVLGTQDMSSISKIYSEDTARSIANNCKTKIFMNVQGKEIAKWCSDSLGEGEIEEWNEGLSYGSHEMRDGIQVNRNKIIKKVVLPSELMMLKSGEGFVNFSGFEPARFRFGDSAFTSIAESYKENIELVELFKQELEEGEKRRREIELKLTNINISVSYDDELATDSKNSDQNLDCLKTIKLETCKEIRGYGW
jgi:type IV conjugative transfer system coupling protein TraD